MYFTLKQLLGTGLDISVYIELGPNTMISCCHFPPEEDFCSSFFPWSFVEHLLWVRIQQWIRDVGLPSRGLHFRVEKSRKNAYSSLIFLYLPAMKKKSNWLRPVGRLLKSSRWEVTVASSKRAEEESSGQVRKRLWWELPDFFYSLLSSIHFSVTWNLLWSNLHMSNPLRFHPSHSLFLLQ